jgi:hypothetical protein
MKLNPVGARNLDRFMQLEIGKIEEDILLNMVYFLLGISPASEY